MQAGKSSVSTHGAPKPRNQGGVMNDSDARFEERLIDGQVVTIPSAPSLQEISRHPDFLGAPVYLEGTRRLVTDLLTFVTKHPDTFRLGITRSKGLRSWTVLPLLLIGERLQRVHIEYVTCGQCGRRPTMQTPRNPACISVYRTGWPSIALR